MFPEKIWLIIDRSFCKGKKDWRGDPNLWIISNLVEKKTRFLSEKHYFQSVLWIEDFPYGQLVPCPGKRAFASPKKAVVLLSPMRASAPCCRVTPFPPRLFAEKNKEGKGKV